MVDGRLLQEPIARTIITIFDDSQSIVVGWITDIIKVYTIK